MISKIEMKPNPNLEKRYMNSIFFLVAINILYLVPIVFLITIGILNFDDNVSQLPSWTFMTASLILVYLLVHWIQIAQEAEYEKSDFEKFAEKEKDYCMKLNILTDSKTILLTLYFILIYTGFYTSYTRVASSISSSRHYYFYLEMLVFCSISLAPYVVVGSYHVYLKFEIWRKTLHAKTLESVVLIV